MIFKHLQTRKKKKKAPICVTDSSLMENTWGCLSASAARAWAIGPCGLWSLWSGLASHRPLQIPSGCFPGSLEAGWTPRTVCCVLLALPKQFFHVNARMQGFPTSQQAEQSYSPNLSVVPVLFLVGLKPSNVNKKTDIIIFVNLLYSSYTTYRHLVQCFQKQEEYLSV